jgi:hypothetical protein
MKETDTTLSYYSSIFIQLIFVLLLVIIWSYIYKLENIGCECADHSNREFIKNFTVIALVYFFITAFISIKSIAKNMGNTIVQLLAFGTFVFFLTFVVYIYYAFDYVKYSTNYTSYYRVSGIFGDELILGAFLTYLGIPVLGYYYSNFSNLNNKKKI